MKKYFLLFGMVAGFCSQASALSVDWAGTYRFEAVQIDKTYLDSGHGEKAYILNHLNLSPKIIAADGVNLVANFEVLGNPQYSDSQAGQLFGRGDSGGTNSNVNSQTEGSSTLSVRELYMRLDQEYGELVVGRAPVEFGVGMTYNAGHGVFDHWGDTYDMVAYKFMLGNLSITPMIGRPYDYSPSQGRSITDLMAQVEYNNPETESIFGVLYRTRNSSSASNDGPNVYDTLVNPNYTFDPTTHVGSMATTHTNVYLARGWDSFKFRLEGGFDSGTTGLTDATNNEVKVNGYGIALELDFPRPESKWQYNMKLGIASGDNPTSSNYEGYHFDRNYDLGFLLFNHPMGNYDVLRNRVQRNSDRNNVATSGPRNLIPNEEALDEDTISNAIFIAPKISYSFSDKFEWRNILVYAQTQTNPSLTGDTTVGKELGWEWDTALIYRPQERIQWVNEIGMFLPGNAYKGGALGYTAGFNYGFQSRAAISF